MDGRGPIGWMVTSNQFGSLFLMPFRYHCCWVTSKSVFSKRRFSNSISPTTTLYSSTRRLRTPSIWPISIISRPRSPNLCAAKKAPSGQPNATHDMPGCACSCERKTNSRLSASRVPKTFWTNKVRMAVCAARAWVVMVSSSFPTAATICSSMVAASAWLFCSAVRHHKRWTPIALITIEASTRPVRARRIPTRMRFQIFGTGDIVALDLFVIACPFRKTGFHFSGSCSNGIDWRPCSATPVGFAARHPDPLDFPGKLDAGIVFYPLAHGFAQRLDFGRRGVAEIDQEIAMQLGDLRTADAQAPATSGINQLPGLMAGWVLEGRTAGAAFHRLSRLAAFRDLVHLGGDGIGIAWPAGEQRLGKNHVVGNTAMAIGEIHLGVGEGADISAAIDAARLDQDVLGLAPIGAAVHPQGAADAAGDAAQKRQAGDTGFLRGAGHFHIRHRCSNADLRAVGGDHAEAFAQPDDDTFDTAIA